MAELLSICIPTFNRASYLRELLEGLVVELEQTAHAPDLVRLYLSDNASTDEANEVVQSFASRWPVLYNRNPVNIGGDHNFAQMISRAEGTYFWLVGDDEWVIPGFLPPLLELLKSEKHHLILLEAIPEKERADAPPPAREESTFPNYAAFVTHYGRSDPWKLIAHSLISLMVIKRAAFDQEMSRKMLKTVDRNYSHMYGLVEGLQRTSGSIHLHSVPSVRIRARRALVDTAAVEVNSLWPRYYRWLGLKFGHPELITYGKSLFGWKKRWKLVRHRLKRAFGMTPDIARKQ